MTGHLLETVVRHLSKISLNNAEETKRGRYTINMLLTQLRNKGSNRLKFCTALSAPAADACDCNVSHFQ